MHSEMYSSVAAHVQIVHNQLLDELFNECLVFGSPLRQEAQAGIHGPLRLFL